MYFRIPPSTQDRPISRSSSTHPQNRLPLSSPTITPPSLSTETSVATRGTSGSHRDAAKARALLSRVASSPITPRRSTSSIPGSPTSLRSEKHEHGRSPTEAKKRPGESVVAGLERRYSDGFEASRGWTGYKQKGGYVSFPDYEKYFPENEGGQAVAT